MKKFLLFFLLAAPVIFAAEYNVDKSKTNLVKFISNAPIESFEGITNSIDGYMLLENLRNFENSRLYFEVDLNTVDTGIGLRNRHMRENYLETDKFRYTFFEGKFVSITDTTGGEYNCEVSGAMFIHGVTKNISVKGKIKPTEDGFYVEADFIVKLSDFKIDIPKLMFMKIDENMKLELSFYLKKIK